MNLKKTCGLDSIYLRPFHSAYLRAHIQNHPREAYMTIFECGPGTQKDMTFYFLTQHLCSADLSS